jgi:hypothetical protein
MSLSWREMNASTTQWSLAGRTDAPARGTDDAVSSVVQFGWNTWNQYTVNRQIREQLEAWRPNAEPVLSQAPSGQGMLAVAVIEEIRYDQQRLQCNVAVTVYTDRTFQNTVPAMRWYENMSSTQHGAYRAGPQAAIGGSIVRRFFWGQFIVPVGPFNFNGPPVDSMHTHGPAGSRQHVARNSWRG